jgi:murein DD-endopeptidase MepM/ murein hydrolase activator NlpD
MRPGIVRHVSYGSAFGRHQVAVVCTDGTEDFYAHMRARIAAGTHVSAGDRIGEVGAEGNVTGPHLHFERHSRQGHWNCDVITNPAPSIAWEAAQTVTGGGDMPGLRQAGKVYASKMVPGIMNSDSVWNVQVALRAWDPTITWKPTGNFGSPTREAVTRFQREHGWTGINADGIPGPQTVHQLGLTWVDDQ